MSKEIALFHKSRYLVKVTNANVTAIQRKAYNYVFLKAREALKENASQSVFYFSYSEIEKMIGGNKTNNKQLYNALKALQRINIEVIRDEKNWGIFNLFALVDRKEDKLRIQLPVSICEELLNGSYRTIDLLEIKELESKYAIIFYEIFQDQLKDQQIKYPIWTIDERKKLLGIEEKKGYINFAEVRRAVLDLAIKEIKTKKKICLGYDLWKDGKTYSKIQFKFLKNPPATTDDYDPVLDCEGKEIEGYKQTKLLLDDILANDYLELGLNKHRFDRYETELGRDSLEYGYNELSATSKTIEIKNQLGFAIDKAKWFHSNRRIEEEKRIKKENLAREKEEQGRKLIEEQEKKILADDTPLSPEIAKRKRNLKKKED